MTDNLPINGKNEKPEWELKNNQLVIRVKTEAKFLEKFEEYFWKLMNSQYHDLILDFSRSIGLADDAYRMVALQMLDISKLKKELVIRIPVELERFFRHAQLYRVAEIESVKLIGKKETSKDAQQVLENAAQQIGSALTKKDDQADSDLSIDKDKLVNLLKDRFNQQVKIQKEEEEKKLGQPDEIRTGKGRLIDRRTGQVVEINKNPTFIGRVPGNDILIAIPLVSRQHAKIFFDGTQYFIEDMRSSNGTYVNGIRISENQSLFDGARIQIAVTAQYPSGAKEYTFRQDKT